MNPLKPNFLNTAVAVFTLCVLSCSYSSTFTPDFNGKQLAVFDSLKRVYGFEHTHTEEKKTSSSGGEHTVLTIKFINGKNIPTDNDAITALAKQIALKIKQTLKNPKEIESYTILFDTRIIDGSLTTNKYVGHEFKPGEI